MGEAKTSNSFKIVARPFDDSRRPMSISAQDEFFITDAIKPLLCDCTNVNFAVVPPVEYGVTELVITFTGLNETASSVEHQLGTMGYYWRVAYEAGILKLDGSHGSDFFQCGSSGSY